MLNKKAVDEISTRNTLATSRIFSTNDRHEVDAEANEASAGPRL